MRLWSAISLFLVLLLSAAAYVQLPGTRSTGTLDINPPTPYFRYGPLGEPRGQVLVVHGLDSNKNVGNFLSYSLAEAGFEVISIDLPGHGDSAAGFDALVARQVIRDTLDKLGPGTAVVGHSMGGALLLDVADDQSVGNMVLFSPAPTPIEKVLADRILLIGGEFDPERIRAFVPQVIAATAGPVDFLDLPWAGHSSGLFRPDVIRSVAVWLGGHTENVRIERRMGLWAIMFAASIGFGIALIGCLRSRVPPPGTPEPWPRVILHYIAAGIIAVVILALVGITDWLRLFSMDYLIGFLFIAGLVLMWGRRPANPQQRSVLIALCAAAYVIAVPCLLIGSEAVHLTLSSGRWWRFLAIAVLSFPVFLADELVIRPLTPGLKRVSVAIVTRALLGAIAVTGVLIFNRSDAFLLLLAHLIVIFWVGLWFAGGAVQRRTQDAASTALFVSLVQAWVFASIFVVI